MWCGSWVSRGHDGLQALESHVRIRSSNNLLASVSGERGRTRGLVRHFLCGVARRCGAQHYVRAREYQSAR